MTETTTTIRAPVVPVLRVPVAATFVAGLAIVAAVGVATSFGRPEVAAPAGPRPAVVDTHGYAGSLHSEYLLEISRDWAPVPMTLAQRQMIGDLNSEYLISIGDTFYVPMTRDQARIRGELNSEYLRESALGW
jgi:hypothetical protein